ARVEIPVVHGEVGPVQELEEHLRRLSGRLPAVRGIRRDRLAVVLQQAAAFLEQLLRSIGLRVLAGAGQVEVGVLDEEVRSALGSSLFGPSVGSFESRASASSPTTSTVLSSSSSAARATSGSSSISSSSSSSASSRAARDGRRPASLASSRSALARRGRVRTASTSCWSSGSMGMAGYLRLVM